MEWILEESWREKLKDEMDEPYYRELVDKVQEEYENETCYPPEDKIFNALNLCPFDKVKVVIMGQDPYFNPGQAMGLSFSVPEGVQLPPSLQNIYKEIAADLGTASHQSGDLTRWAEQGVLLLNATLTVRAHVANSHQRLGWGTFTDAAIKALSDGRENLVFMLWGGFARSKKALIDQQRHCVIESVHPSQRFANRGGWFGQHQFSRCNAYLTACGAQPIEW